jgi:hypothetical protein
MLYPALEERLRNARLALDGAVSENVMALCKQYLGLLAEYRAELYRLPDTLALNLRAKTSTAPADVDGARKAVRAAIEHTTAERVWAEALILSFTAISGYGAVETFNRQRYMDRDDWKLDAGGVSSRDDAGGRVIQRMTIEEAIETAGLLRREEHVAGCAVAAGARALDSNGNFQPSASTPERR